MAEDYQDHGEISLAHNGVLFLDELLEFKSDILELLRTPLEDKTITINRIYGSLTYPSDFMLIASMNPCPCGYYGSKEKNCNCSIDQINKYRNRFSGPLLDRIDIQLEVPQITYTDLSIQRPNESSKEIKARVNRARNIQLERYKNEGIYCNSQLNSNLIQKYCMLDTDSKNLLKNAFEKLHLSARAHDRILKLARTIADLSESKNIEINHLAEAIQYRVLDRKYWG